MRPRPPLGSAVHCFSGLDLVSSQEAAGLCGDLESRQLRYTGHGGPAVGRGVPQLCL